MSISSIIHSTNDAELEMPTDIKENEDEDQREDNDGKKKGGKSVVDPRNHLFFLVS